MSLKSYMNSREYQHAALSGLDTGISRFFYANLAEELYSPDLVCHFREAAQKAQETSASYFHERPLHAFLSWISVF